MDRQREAHTHDTDHERPLPTVTDKRAYSHCRGTRHGQAKRIETWSKAGLLGWCKLCHEEVITSWEEIERIKAALTGK